MIDEVELKIAADEYYDLAATKKKVEADMKMLKNVLTEKLDASDIDVFDFKNGVKAAKQSRVGTVDMKALQIKYNISDSDLDSLRKQPSTTWVFRIK